MLSILSKKYTVEDVQYPDNYPKLEEKQIKSILRHCNRWGIKPVICAYYDDWQDFCSDWCDNIGLTKTEARELLYGAYRDKSEFLKTNTGLIYRFER